MTSRKPRQTVHDVSITGPSRCLKCKSTAKRVLQTRRKSISGLDRAGDPFDMITYRRVRCLNCGQMREDRELSFRGKNPDKNP